MRILCDTRSVELVNEPTYTFGSADNVRTYPFEKRLTAPGGVVSVHGALVDGQPCAVFGAAGGASAVHERSAVWAHERLHVAVGDHLVCMSLDPFDLEWAVRVDPATCFGVHYQARHDALISHGELEIARLSAPGKVLWSTSGEDIFSERFSLEPDFIEAVDFNGRTYRFRYDDGALLKA